MISRFVVTVEDERDVRVIRPFGELDISTVAELTTVMERECSTQDLVVDLRGLSFLDCAGLRVLLYANGLASSNGCRMHLIPGPPIVQRIFGLTGLDKRFDFVPPAATRRFQRRSAGSPVVPATDAA